ncbi:MAG: sigma-70 family RNA polymerase sigma factor [Oscillospiraceae bacterium]|nr:sigma-70 family RNA polymerase sigma factor [Oscillospiraceae bacterium]
MQAFETLLAAHRGAVERYVKFRLPAEADADDVIQEVFVTAYRKFGQLKDPAAFKSWILAIARNRCNDWFRQRAKHPELPLEELPETAPAHHPPNRVIEAVQQTLAALESRQRQILQLYYFAELSQAEIAKRLDIPVGTVKSRLHTAREQFRKLYPYPPKGGNTMQKIPDTLPAYTIEPSSLPPFPIRWEELMGWFLVPKLGESLSWGIYDYPSRRCSCLFEMAVTGKARVHGIEGVEITAVETPFDGSPEKDVIAARKLERRFVAQLTDTHCRYLAASYRDGDTTAYITFLDGEPFTKNWGFGENNCGNEVQLAPKGDIRREGSIVTTADKAFLLDVVGRYVVTIGGRSYDTICVMDIETYDDGMATEQFLDQSGRTVLWRRFNRNDWKAQQYGGRWTELLPDMERLTVNGETYVHWYDCITSHICR